MDNILDPVLVGHPFAPIGRGEDVRCSFRALQKINFKPKVMDLYGIHSPVGPLQNEIFDQSAAELGRVNIFHLNGDEIPQAIKHVGQSNFESKYNVIYPQWELSKYPIEWAAHLDKFNEIWAPSQFVFESIKPVVSRPIFYMPLACEVEITQVLPRSFFGIRDSAYAFLFFFDFRSYWQRKNPNAVIDAFERLIARTSTRDLLLVIKVNGVEIEPDKLKELEKRVESMKARVVILKQTLSDNQTKNLIRCCDCFVSLHRSEGFGRGMSEAMFLGKPVIATAYSGNLDFMRPLNSLLVDAKLIEVHDGEYPYWRGQQWADPNIDQTVSHMGVLVENPSRGYKIGRAAAQSILCDVGYLSAGLRMRQRIAEIGKSAPIKSLKREHLTQLQRRD